MPALFPPLESPPARPNSPRPALSIDVPLRRLPGNLALLLIHWKTILLSRNVLITPSFNLSDISPFLGDSLDTSRTFAECRQCPIPDRCVIRLDRGKSFRHFVVRIVLLRDIFCVCDKRPSSALTVSRLASPGAGPPRPGNTRKKTAAPTAHIYMRDKEVRTTRRYIVPACDGCRRKQLAPRLLDASSRAAAPPIRLSAPCVHFQT